jgi:dienelactone hydrolase
MNAFAYTDPEAAKSDRRFYRTGTNHLITAMLNPTGPHSVGMVNRWLTDPTRRNRFGISTNGSFMVMIWYPAVPEPGRLPDSWEDAPLLRDPGWVTWAFDREPYFVSHAVPGAPCAMEGHPYPIVLYSHGLGAFRYDQVEKAENLASHGYILVGIDHVDAFRAALSDGTVANLPAPTATKAVFEDRLMDFSFVLHELARWNNTDPAFAGRFDLAKVAAMGTSWGGGVAGEFARIDDRFKAVVLLDAYLQNADDLVRLGLSKPFIGMYSTALGGETALFNKATKDAVWFRISSSEHANFADFYWWDFPGSLAAAREAARTINAYTLWFLNKHVKGSTDPMPALADYPRVVNFRQK